jgi:NAD(P)-dependent dehydrogenase (short-subunit alcohol dehydrogenase family)
MKAIVVGASSGLGRCIGVGLAQQGAQVAFLARRADRLAGAVGEAGDKAIAIGCDVMDPDSCRTGIEKAVDQLGGLDSFVYAAGIGPLVRITETDLETWHRVLDTNVVGAALATSVAIPHLTESGGAAVYLSSTSASQTAPLPGLGAYAVSKAALDKLIEAFRSEHPTVGFTRVVVGDCAGGEGDSGTGFPMDWDPELAAEVAPIWVQRNLLVGALVPVEELVRMVHQVLTSGASTSIPSIVVAPRSPA